MDHRCLGCVVSSLQLRDVDHVTRHRRCGNERATLEALETVLLLLTPNCAAGPSAIERAVKIGGDDVLIVIELAVDHRALGPRNAGVGDKNVQAIIEFGDLGYDGFFDLLRVLHVDLVRLALGAIFGSVKNGKGEN